ncbi:hypothetical protein [Haloactinopolyspora sp.]|uniref:hypothetical protein n=1 Tax=Haloactinopolyspora sp. TaxID=1966353 RepID=UPI002631D997|nr:hypothetical protein [Haloactinopolyspora sp.]
MPTTTVSTRGTSGRTRTGARRRDGGLVGRLNAEWARLCADDATSTVVASWSDDQQALAGRASLDDVERTVTEADRLDADRILLALLRLAQDGDELAARTVLQLMLGKAVRIANTYTGRDTHENVEHLAVAALWSTIATYPTTRRPTKVAANLAMDTMRAVSAELAYARAESPLEPEILADRLADPPYHAGAPADLELIELLAWAVDHGAVTPADATLIVDVYAPAAGEPGGAEAATRHGLTWPAARQRCSRAVRRIAAAVRADVPA